MQPLEIHGIKPLLHHHSPQNVAFVYMCMWTNNAFRLRLIVRAWKSANGVSNIIIFLYTRSWPKRSPPYSHSLSYCTKEKGGQRVDGVQPDDVEPLEHDSSHRLLHVVPRLWHRSDERVPSDGVERPYENVQRKRTSLLCYLLLVLSRGEVGLELERGRLGRRADEHVHPSDGDETIHKLQCNYSQSISK